MIVRVLAALVLLVSAAATQAGNRVRVSSGDLAKAIAEVTSNPAYGIDPSRIAPIDIRVRKCIKPNEEPTEFRCTWLQRTSRGWMRHQNWLAIDEYGWHVID